MWLAVLLAVAPVQDVTWRPVLPRQGSLVIVSAPNGVGGELAGEPLHFDSAGRAFGAVPLGATDSIALRIITRAGSLTESRTSVPIASRARLGEQLTAAERFTVPQDRTMQIRLAAERELSRDAARRAHDVPRLWNRPFIRPRPRATRVTSPFGAGREVNGVSRSTHSGLDLAGKKGEPVRASNRGVVALVGDFFYGGISVYVHHGAGIMTIYHHLSRSLVAAGDTVERGQVIGRVGATGRVTGPHLHWQAQYGAVPFDPVDLLTLP